jgi:diaminohydroxyphosphoribosylaminopyrimidine deaminase/5-amino-6-(5-phosphoribosylamino)uracil reductase
MTTPSFTEHDHRYMARALELAARGLYTTDPNPRVGCVLVKDGVTVGEGFHERAGGPHAEIVALTAAGKATRGTTAYVTLEPCCHHGRTPPCTDALIAAGVARVVVGATDPNPRVAGQGLHQLEAAGITCATGLMAAQSEALNPGFMRRMRTGRPYVRVKLAMSLDGRTAMASGESRWITGEAARADVQHLRARSSAILTGTGTALADDPRLTLREPALAELARPPLKVLLDTGLRVEPTAALFNVPGRALIFTAERDAARHAPYHERGVEVVVIAVADGGLDLQAVMNELAERECNELLVEAGATLNGALLSAGLVDEIVIYLAPHLMGDAARGLFHLPQIARMSERLPLAIRETRAVGNDWRITAIPQAQD